MSNHFEGLGKTWLTLLNDPEKEVPAVVMQVMKEGKTRDCWQRKDSKRANSSAPCRPIPCWKARPTI